MSRLTRFLTGAVLCAVTMAPGLVADAAASTYVVRSGDSLYVIASRLGVRLDDLLRVNRLTVTSLIVPGQRLAVPGTTGSSGGSGGSPSTTYVVQAGDWLSKIASRHGVTLTALLAANHLTATSLIVPGQHLVIPSSNGAGGGGGGGGGSGSGGGGGGGGVGATTYIVKAGDWLGRIASGHGITLRTLLDANGLTATSLIVPGQRLSIPSSAGSPVRPPSAPVNPPAGGTAYTVRPGDSLGAIAAQNGVSLGALLAVNGFSRNSLIMPGQQIELPARAAAPRIDRVLDYALRQVGKPYRFFGSGPWAFDCSGLTLAAYAQIDVSLVHYSAAQARQGVAVDFRNGPIRAGDLVFQDTDGDGVINHVGIALNESTWVHARSTRSAVARGPIPADSRIVAVRRILPDG